MFQSGCGSVSWHKKQRISIPTCIDCEMSGSSSLVILNRLRVARFEPVEDQSEVVTKVEESGPVEVVAF